MKEVVEMEIAIEQPWQGMVEAMSESDRNEFVNRAIKVMVCIENRAREN
jgi:hypothetical protein